MLQMRVCQRGWAGQLWACYHKTPSLLLAGPGPAQPIPSPHLYRQGLGPARPPKSLTFIDGARHPKPFTSIGQTHARPFASISQARPRNPSRRNPAAKKRANGTAAPYFPRFGAFPIWQTLMLQVGQQWLVKSARFLLTIAGVLMQP